MSQIQVTSFQMFFMWSALAACTLVHSTPVKYVFYILQKPQSFVSQPEKSNNILS